jgi:hypothetical protein
MKALKMNVYKKYFSISHSLNEGGFFVPKKMRAIMQNEKGDASTLFIGETDTPVK